MLLRAVTRLAPRGVRFNASAPPPPPAQQQGSGNLLLAGAIVAAATAGYFAFKKDVARPGEAEKLVKAEQEAKRDGVTSME